MSLQKKLLLKKIESYNLVKKFRNLLPNGKILLEKNKFNKFKNKYSFIFFI